jgi:squalene-associated FAD-dependent desaturase
VAVVTGAGLTGVRGTGAPERAVVIGGGLAGVTAALDLAEAGVAVTLLESRPRLGGNAGSTRRDGLPVDTGQHVFLRCCTAYRGLLDRLDAAGSARLQDRLHVPVLFTAAPGAPVRRTRLTRSRLPLPAPAHLAGSLIRYPALPPRARLSAALAVRALGQLDPAAPDTDTVRFGAWLTAHRQGPAAVTGLFELLTVATLNTAVDAASLALAATVVQEGLLRDPGGGDIGWAAVPLGDIHDERARTVLAARGVQVHDSDRVTGLRDGWAATDPRGGGGWTVTTRGGSLDTEAVVLAVPPEQAGALYPGLAASAAALAPSPIVNVHLRYDRTVADFPPDAPFAAAVGSPVQWVFDRTAVAGVTEGQYLAISLSAADDYLPQTARALTEQFAAEIARLFPRAGQARLLDAFVTREPAATFRQAAGTAAHRPDPSRLLAPGLAVAGAWTATGWPATMEGAVRSGAAAARALLATPARSTETLRAGVGA